MAIEKSDIHVEPLQKTGALDDKFTYEETTPVIGREYATVNIVNDILEASDADALIRDLAITISERGVVFFRSQHNLTDTLQKQLVHRLGQLTNKPSSSTLHIHPILNNTSEFGLADAEISHISSVARKNLFRQDEPQQSKTRRYDAAQWHSDIQFEPAPADYTSLRLTKLPSTGGDTLWASGYEIYDRFSEAYQRFFEGLTATFSGDGFIKAAAANPERVKIYEEQRGSPLNVGKELTAVHPVVRTNPVTGWKSIFAVGPFPKRINELNAEESDDLLKKFRSVITENHDLQVRLKWKGENDLAIWDNRSVFHSATFDYEGLGDRFGHRAVGIGEEPYFDPKSNSRTEGLAGNIEREAVNGKGVDKAETVSA
ncbi:taurine dioxygenase family protein [Lophiostoma macrostomum CBS 122681]|uniref:Taurine dioxygenase family protein n=1 Tax=Lophiostoma macrostomum CBS 122681 TaxID=1314788 RepID=A0A6A6T9T6_9PLEO|nr:taurine dioxygenase family protein [Lophiostoma macrostomum CBS 122681]